MEQIERRAVLEEIGSILAQLKSGPAQESATDQPRAKVLNMHGIPGIGKTVLCEQIFERFQTSHSLIWLDFEPLHSPQAPRPAVPLSEAIEQLWQIPVYEYIPDTIIFLDGSEEYTGNYEVFFRRANLDHPTEPFLLLLDHLDDIPYWKWVQNEIIKPLIKEHSALVITTSQVLLFWDFWELLEICQPYAIGRFTETEITTLLRQANRELLAGSYQALTYGYPMQVQQAQAFLEPCDKPAPPSPVLPEELREKLDALDPTSRLVFSYTGLLRRLEVAIMHEILDMEIPEWRTTSPPHNVLLGKVLPALTAHNFLEPYRRKQAYWVKPAIRQALDDHLRTTEPERYQRICHLIRQIYARRFMEKPIDNVQSLNEWLFFSLSELSGETSAPGTETGPEAQRCPVLLSQMLKRASVPGKRVAVALYRDIELVGKLRAYGLLATIQQMMNEYLGNDEQTPPLLDDSERQKYKRDFIRKLSNQYPLSEIQKDIPGDAYTPGGLATLFNAIIELGETFDLNSLHAYLKEWLKTRIERDGVKNALILMESSGLIIYDPSQRTYVLSDSVRAQIAPPRPELEFADVDAISY